MVNNKFRIIFFFAVLVSTFLNPFPAHAICPVCTVAVGAGVGLAQYLGIDDAITGLWIGGLVVSVIWWTINWLNSKNIKFYGRKILVTIFYYAVVVGPLWRKEIIGHPYNKLWGIDKLMLGIALGSVLFIIGGVLHFQLKKRNEDKVYFPFQKVVFSVSPLILFSAVFYFITK